MPVNVGRTDRALRITLGLVTFPFGFFILRGWPGVVVSLTSLQMVAEGIAGFCPAYWLAGVRSVEGEEAVRRPVALGASRSATGT
ncbi:MAG: DUF2892 domain-containing protein [Chloroflexi bacterium]|nr:DUF2892 domain-containing protein [Chloroflexota bacterium]